MTREEFRALIIQESGVIHTDPSGFSVCHSCGAIGSQYEDSIPHAESCRLMQAIRMITSDMPDTFILGVENQLTVTTLLDFLQQLSPEEINQIDELTMQLLNEKNRDLRSNIFVQIAGWAPSADPNLLREFAFHGLKSESQRISFRNYLIFERVTHNELMEINNRLHEVAETREKTGKVFANLFRKKYGVPFTRA